MATSGNSKLSVPTFIPLTEAVRIYNLTEDVLTRLIQDGRIDAAQLPSGELLVSDASLNQKTREQIIKDKFGHLRGNAITISLAAEKYKLAGTTIRKWISRGYISIMDSGYPTKIDEADVAYCRWVYRKRDGRSGARIFDDDGLPYELKRPALSEYRRKKKQRR